MATYTVDPSTFDSFIRADKKSVSGGSSTLLYCQSDVFGNVPRRIIMDFDLSGFPSTTDKITKVEYTYYVQTAAGTTRSAHWNRITQSATTDAATWLKFNGSLDWVNLGGDYTTSGRIMDNLATSTGSKTITASTPSSGGLWGQTVDAIDTYSGKLLLLYKKLTEFGDTDGVVIRSREHATVSTRPKIVITYTDDAVAADAVFMGANF